MAVLADQVERHQPVAPVAVPALVAVVVVGALVAVVGGSVPLAAASMPLAMLPAAVVDLKTFRLPNGLIAGGAAVVGIIAVTERALTPRLDEASLTSISLGVALFAGPLLAVHLVTPAAMGFGDVKLAVALGAAIGLTDAIAALTGLLIACSIATVGGLVARRTTVPFGPALVVGTAAALATGSWVAG